MCDDAEPPEVYRDSHPVARKEHRCCECRGTISPGEQYSRFEGLWDGRFRTYKTCADCQELRALIRATYKDPYNYGPYLGGMYEEVFESRHSTPAWVKHFMDTRRKRNAPPSHKGWMEKLEQQMPLVDTPPAGV